MAESTNLFAYQTDDSAAVKSVDLCYRLRSKDLPKPCYIELGMLRQNFQWNGISLLISDCVKMRLSLEYITHFIWYYLMNSVCWSASYSESSENAHILVLKWFTPALYQMNDIWKVWWGIQSSPKVPDRKYA